MAGRSFLSVSARSEGGTVGGPAAPSPHRVRVESTLSPRRVHVESAMSRRMLRHRSHKSCRAARQRMMAEIAASDGEESAGTGAGRVSRNPDLLTHPAGIGVNVRSDVC